MSRQHSFAALFLLVSVAGLLAQSATERTTALLATGPVERRGIEYFAPDLTSHWYGTYEHPAGIVEIYYADQPIDEAAAWPLSSCGLLRLRSDGQGAVYYLDDERWSVLMIIEDRGAPGFDPCPFASQFVRQFEFFQNLERSVRFVPSPAFPAIVEY